MWTVEIRVGRLVEIQLASPLTMAELAQFGQRVAELIVQQRHLKQRGIVCVDMSAASILPPEAADWLIAMMQRDNPMVERSGFLIGPSAMFALQIERMLKQASPALTRRAFREPAPLVSWLGELLSTAEHARLRQFLFEKGLWKF